MSYGIEVPTPGGMMNLLDIRAIRRTRRVTLNGQTGNYTFSPALKSTDAILVRVISGGYPDIRLSGSQVTWSPAEYTSAPDRFEVTIGEIT